MPELNRQSFVALWNATKAQQIADDPDLALLQKYMLMHEDMHPHFDRIAQDPDAPIDVDGENLPLHIAFDAATERALENDNPPGVRTIMQALLTGGMDPGQAFHVIAQALAHETIIAADQQQEFDPQKFLARAAQYAEQAQRQG